ncbi:hypothetical protein [Vagococcus zengguangii]|uniref:Uncharacterized protein n=1 Tax=Vagococcus zengguangii TaxID=2571750 RepID=A0A4D7CSN8_9ENTE|nr:hypothetical protein [Vagococcus zengguangii]QCI87068.1 hypothetical protein FA707_08855 [Vagococcus zengguangii]TLG80893.1 hypothetical protein FE258_03115 [Vagococcus zengguangii]
MIAIDVAMQQDNVIALLEGLSEGITYKFIEKKGIKLTFEVAGAEPEAAAKAAKEAIKSEPWGKVLYFQCNAM